MLKNIVERQRRTEIVYRVEFLNGDGGYSFPCDRNGKISDLNECAAENYKDCMAHPEQWETWNRITRYDQSYTEPAHGTCACGREVELVDQYYGACQCECGRWYNLFGQELLPPEQWEDDPSESSAWDGYEPWEG